MPLKSQDSKSYIYGKDNRISARCTNIGKKRVHHIIHPDYNDNRSTRIIKQEYPMSSNRQTKIDNPTPFDYNESSKYQKTQRGE